VYFFRRWIARDTVTRALKVTGVVAPALIAINHGSCALRGTLDWGCAAESILTTLVPYLVSSYSSASASLASEGKPE
jgi:hypothetical protein